MIASMKQALDSLDLKILSLVQKNAELSIDELAKLSGSSKTPVWNRLKKLKKQGYITRQVAILDAEAVGLTACFFVLIRTAEHDKDWQKQFLQALQNRPEIQEAHRLAGDVDYLLKVRVRDPADYDRFYQDLVADISIFNVTSLLSMHEIISTTTLHLESLDDPDS